MYSIIFGKSELNEVCVITKTGSMVKKLACILYFSLHVTFGAKHSLLAEYCRCCPF